MIEISAMIKEKREVGRGNKEEKKKKKKGHYTCSVVGNFSSLMELTNTERAACTAVNNKNSGEIT